MLELLFVVGVGAALTMTAIIIVSNILNKKETAIDFYHEIGLTEEDYRMILNRSMEADYGHFTGLFGILFVLITFILIVFIFSKIDNSPHSERKNIEDFTQGRAFLWLIGLYSLQQYFLISFIDSFFYLYLEELVYTLTIYSTLVGSFYLFIKKMINLYKMVNELDKTSTLLNSYMEYKLYLVMQSKFIKDSIKIKLLKKHINNLNHYGTAPFLFLKDNSFYFDESIYRYNCLKEQEFKKSDAFEHLIRDDFSFFSILKNKDFYDEFNRAYQIDSDFKRLINNGIALNFELRDFYLSSFKLNGGYNYIYQYDEGLLTIETQFEKNRAEWVIIND